MRKEGPISIRMMLLEGRCKAGNAPQKGPGRGSPVLYEKVQTFRLFFPESIPDGAGYKYRGVLFSWHSSPYFVYSVPFRGNFNQNLGIKK
jgi:hypothetical protein